MGPGSIGALEVRLDDRSALVGGHLFEEVLLTAAVAEDRSPLGGTDILNPLDVLSQHRYQIALSLPRATTTGNEAVRPDLRPVTSRVTT